VSKRTWLIVLRAFAALASVYLVAVAALLGLENRLLYRPHAHGNYWVPPPPDACVEDIYLRSSRGDEIHAWWCPRDGAREVVLFCHGNAGNLSQRRVSRDRDVIAIAEVLNASVLIFDYPGFGQSSGAPSEAGCYAAGDAAYEWLAERVPPGRIIILGQSLGGGVATDLASRRPHRALALLKTFTSIPDIVLAKFPLLPAHRLMRNQFDNLAKIGACHSPLFIAHGDCDHLIPIGQAERLFAAATAPRELFRMPGCGHCGGVSREFLARFAAFLREHPAGGE
jgi:pimeloyl-ACP methyl ester carboxylesterase